MASAKNEYLDWKRRDKAIACAFARLIALRPEDYGQKVELVGAKSSASRIAASIDARITKLLNNPEVSAATLLFDASITLERFAEALNSLALLDGWSISASVLDHDEISDIASLSLIKDIPYGQEFLPSEVLCFGPYNLMPNTRRSPYPALEMFVGVPLDRDPKSQAQVKKANLAHINMRLPTPEVFQRTWDKTMKQRLVSLGNKEDCRAKAKVTLVVPKALAYDFGLLS